ncbi:MAG: hypothetical protein MH825_15545 [Cyanobacteria bacterium]|nr:hypothetical protein [Cyanobacteriota bacterium]
MSFPQARGDRVRHCVDLGIAIARSAPTPPAAPNRRVYRNDSSQFNG